MVKATLPIRLQEDLMQSATTAGQRMHRSAAEQVEYWASIERSVARVRQAVGGQRRAVTAKGNPRGTSCH